MTRNKLLPLLLACAACAWPETKVLRGFTLIDGTGAAAKPNSAMIVTDGKITWVGANGALKAPAGAETVDLTGKFVMPGIINLHGHIGNTVDLAQDPKNFTRANVEKHLRTYSSYGVTTMISMGSEQPLVWEIRDGQRKGRPNMTRLFTAGRGFTGKAGYPTTAPGMKGVPFEVDTVADVEKALNELAPHKPDIVKIWVDDHLGKERKIPFDLSKAIIDGAHKRGIKVAAHIFYLDDAKKLVAAGLDMLAHSVRDKPVDAELIGLMKQKGAWQGAATFTRELSMYVFAKPPSWIDDPFFTRGTNAGVIKTLKSPEYQKRVAGNAENFEYQKFLKTAQQNMKKLYDSGVNVGFGTDTGPPARFLGFYEHLEMDLMVEAGFTPAQIIQIFSKNSARFLGRSGDLGTLEVGHWADLVVLSKNPLENIRNARAIEKVYVAGNVAN